MFGRPLWGLGHDLNCCTFHLPPASFAGHTSGQFVLSGDFKYCKAMPRGEACIKYTPRSTNGQDRVPHIVHAVGWTREPRPWQIRGIPADPRCGPACLADISRAEVIPSVSMPPRE